MNDHYKDEIAVAVIAGGKSRRFGTNKAVAMYRENQLINIATQTGYKISRDVFLVMGSLPHENNMFAPVIADIVPDCGPLGGICTALFHSKKPYVCVLPCDMPLLTNEVYEFLIKFRTQQQPVVARSENGLEPLVSIWPKSLSGILFSNLEKGYFRMHSILKDLDAVEVNLHETWNSYNKIFFSNINYREDLDKLHCLNVAV